MSVKERDPLTGHQTTGHEWNGITELNTRVPRVMWWFIGVTHVYALIVWVLYPAWPLVNRHTEGLLGGDQHTRLARSLESLEMTRADWKARIASTPMEEIRQDPKLMNIVDETAPALFGDNCAVCHGQNATGGGAAGGPGFPSLVDDAWLWGGDPDTILETLRVGINADHPDTRFAQMPALGETGALTSDEVRTVAAYEQSLSGAEIDDETRAAGGELFAANCASCHGPEGEGMHSVGAPDLTDDFWIYGGDSESLYRTINAGRQGWMPSWESRLSEVDRRLLALYLLDLGEGTQ